MRRRCGDCGPHARGRDRMVLLTPKSLIPWQSHAPVAPVCMHPFGPSFMHLQPEISLQQQGSRGMGSSTQGTYRYEHLETLWRLRCGHRLRMRALGSKLGCSEGHPGLQIGWPEGIIGEGRTNNRAQPPLYAPGGTTPKLLPVFVPGGKTQTGLVTAFETRWLHCASPWSFRVSDSHGSRASRWGHSGCLSSRERDSHLHGNQAATSPA